MNKTMFSWEGSLISFLSQVGKLIVLSILWIVSCIPVVTFGLASTALYYTVVKVVRHDRGYVFGEFFGALRREWRQGIAFSLIYLMGFVILYLDFMVWSEQPKLSALIFSIVCIVIAALWSVSACYVFSLISRFEMSFVDVIKTAWFLMFRYLPTSVGLLLILFLSVECVFASIYFLPIVPGVAAFCMSFLVERIFVKMIPEPEEGEEQWFDDYNEEEEDA